ncbi:TRAP transporter small permease [Frigidibacter oleivorans]|uniref:TRAP transporter small permease n=1 Tax=Frigidibacter oleivorans TaxID=2487129 RepID=UPI000F8D920E|nr:TRAP transporter small permease [Frigidibacter oleivorans]
MSVSSIGTAWAGFIKLLFLLGATYLGAIVIGTLWDVIARNLFVGTAPVWLSTAIDFGLPCSAMLAAPWLVRTRGHVAMELIDGALTAPARRVVIRLTDLAAAAICLLVAGYAALGGLAAFQRGEVILRSVDVPRWSLYAILSAGLFLCAIEFLRHVALSLGGRNTGSVQS